MGDTNHQYSEKRAEMIELTSDIMNGAAEIAAFLNVSERRVFYIAERNLLPIFRVGTNLTARKSTLLRVYARKEEEAISE